MQPIDRRAAIGAVTGLLIGSHEGQAATNTLPVGASATTTFSEEFVLSSAEGRSFNIRIGLPEPVAGASASVLPAPVYVLDGGLFFGAVTSLSRLMQLGGDLLPCLVVAIGYPDEERATLDQTRLFDLTPTANPSHGYPSDPKQWGGSAAFRIFIQTVLRPSIEKRFRVDTKRSTLIGHSLGGLFVMDDLITNPGAYANYLAISPSLWFDNEMELAQMGKKLDDGQRFPGRLAVYAGEREERLGAHPDTFLTHRVLQLGRLVAQHRSAFDEVTVRIIPEASHYSIPGPALTAGLQFLLSPDDRRNLPY